MGFVGFWKAGSFSSTRTWVTTVATSFFRPRAAQLVADGVLQVVADAALAHGAALGEGHLGLDGAGLGGRGSCPG